MKLPVVTLLVFVANTAVAHKVTTAFPDGATLLGSDSLKSALEGRKFTAQPAEGPSWHLVYGKGGDFSVRAGSFSDEGKWTTGESAVCTEGKKLKHLCNDVRLKDGKLFLQRRGGEVMQLIPN